MAWSRMRMNHFRDCADWSSTSVLLTLTEGLGQKALAAQQPVALARFRDSTCAVTAMHSGGLGEHVGKGGGAGAVRLTV